MVNKFNCNHMVTVAVDGNHRTMLVAPATHLTLAQPHTLRIIVFYKFRLNNSIALMNIDHQTITDEAKSTAKDLGKESGWTVHETALVLVSQLAASELKNFNKNAVWHWFKSGAVSRDKDGIGKALFALGFDPEEILEFLTNS